MPKSEALEEETPIDYRFDIDALFAYLTGEEVGHQLEDELDWSFGLRSKNVELLETLADELEAEFLAHVQHMNQEKDSEGNVQAADPILVLVTRSAMKPDEVKAVADRMQKIADERGLIYEGVDCCDPVDYEEVFGWFQPEEATSRLKNMTAGGLEPDVPLPLAVLIQTPSFEANRSVMAELAGVGMADADEFDEPDEDGKFGLCLFLPVTNNEPVVEEALHRVSTIVARFDGLIDGVQFYTREEVQEVFGEEDDFDPDSETQLEG